MKIEPGWRKPVGVALGAVSYPGPFLLHSAMLVGHYSLKKTLFFYNLPIMEESSEIMI